MKIAAIYARVSSARQKQQETIDSQVAALLEYAQSHDYQVSPQHIFQDNGHSGARLDRPALDRLRDAVAQGELEAVLILAPDRLARQFAYQYLVLEELERAGCQVRFLHQGLGQTPSERMLLEMTSVFAEYERAQITERCRRGRLYRARQGSLSITQAPYGYTCLPRREAAPGQLIINETEAEVVRQIFHWLADDQLSAYQIVKRLNESGLRTRHGKERWARGYIINLLRNPVYTGTYHYNRRQQVPSQRKNLTTTAAQPARRSHVWRPEAEWIPIAVPTIIDQETWDLAQQQLQLNRERAIRNNKQHDYLLKGLLVCAHCHLRMFGNAGEGRHRRYRCSRQETLRLHPEPCSGRSVLAERIEELVWESVSELLRDPHLLLEQYQLRRDQSYGTPEQQEQQRLTRKLATLGREEQRLLDAYQASVIELPELKERCARIGQERARLESRVKVIEQQRQSQQQQAALSATMEEFCRSISDALDNPNFETK